MENKKFDQAKYMRDWQKEFVEEFKEACKKLNIKQSDVIRKAMQKTIDQANK